MKYLDEYRDAGIALALVEDIRRDRDPAVDADGGLRRADAHARPPGHRPAPADGAVELVHGPGCPVCVTPLELIDEAIAIAERPDVDLLLVRRHAPRARLAGGPASARGRAGADVRVVYSPLDAVEVARRNPDRTVVFFAVGFETTAPANAMAVWQAKALGHRQLRGAGGARAGAAGDGGDPRVARATACRGSWPPGHVCTVMGWTEYEPIAAGYRVPIVVTGFEPVDLLEGILMLVRQLEDGRHEVENQYVRSVRREGNPPAQARGGRGVRAGDRAWRGIGVIPNSGFRLTRGVPRSTTPRSGSRARAASASESEVCIAGQVLQGRAKPFECPAFGGECTPDHPLGAPMVSTEGACAAYFLARPRGPARRLASP